MKTTERTAGRIESAPVIDLVADPVSGWVARLLPGGRVKDFLSGTWLGHPLHPMAVGVPIGALAGVSALDLVPGDEVARRRLMGLGLVAALPAAAAGAADWSDTEGGARRVGAVHAVLNAAALALYAASFVRRRRPGDGRWLAVTGLALMAGGGWLGGHLAYALGVGVDTTAFETGPADWTAVGSADEFPFGRPVAVETGTARVVVLRETGDRLRAMANRCTHRGGPLAEGKIEGECVTCPWHGSRFALADGEVRRGPATRPQPIYDVRLHRDHVEIRRARS